MRGAAILAVSLGPRLGGRAMARFEHSIRARKFLRSTAFLLAVGGIGYVAGAVVHGTQASGSGSAVLARPAQAAEPDVRIPLPASSTFTPAAADWSRAGGSRIPQPRECDMAQGISTECVFMD